ncbi:MAG: T9SS type A sorting domain-containing protein [Melioribacteraceae bacterium]
MNKNLVKYFIYMLVLTLPFALFAKGGDGKNQLRKTQGSPSYTRFNINNVSSYIYNDGRSDIQPNGNSGFIFPKFSNKAPFFQSGFLWGGKVDNQIRVGGAVYRTGTRPGRILENGTAASESDPDVRIYRVRRDVAGNVDPAKLLNKVKPEARDEGITTSEVVSQYQLDWNEWPASQGAPYEDIDKNGSYDPTKDIPGFVGADQTVWFVNNDLDPGTTDFMYGTLPMGIEQQVTIWGYNKAGDLGNMMFRKYLIINKNSAKKPFTDMYVSMWSDPDNGDAGDDFAGCDTTLSLFYIYNAKANDATYGTNPPAAGFDFFQGPRVKTDATTDTAIYKGKKWVGYKNLPMTSFYYFAQGGGISTDYADPSQGVSSGAQEFYNLFQGLVGKTGQPFPIPAQAQVPGGPTTTSFPLSGDPVSGSGYIDGIIVPAADRRMGAASGKFTLAYGDTQEVVVAELAAGARSGIGNIRAVTLLKAADKEAQKAFNNFFPKPTPFLNPVVEVVNLDKQIVLNWGSDVVSANTTENYVDEFYQFQGYEVYQLATEGSSLEDPETVRIGTYDIIDGKTSIIGQDIDPVSSDVISKVYHYGKDTGLNRSVTINKSYISNENLNNGSKYYFAVRAYATTDSTFIEQKSITTTLDVLTAVPQSPNPGVRYEGTVGQLINAAHSKGVSGGKAEAVVVDPTKLTGHTYEVAFATTGWNVKDTKTGITLVKDQQDQEGSDASPIVDGLKVKVYGAADEITKFLVTANGSGKLSPAQMGTFAFNSNGFPTHDGADRPSAGQQSTNASLWGIATGSTGTALSFSGFLSRVARNDNFSRIVPFDWEIRFTATGSKALLAFTNNKIIDVPFELWNTGIGTPNDPSDDYKVVPLVYDLNGNDVFDLDKVDHPVSGGDNDPETDWIYVYDVTDHTPGTKGYDAAIASNFDEGTTHTVGDEVMARLVVVNFNGGSVAAANWPDNVNSKMPETGTIFRIETSKPNYPGADVFTFTAPSVTVSADQAKADVDMVNVFPNPYYGVNSQEINKYQRFVTFNHLPKVATIRIFNLAGQLVRTIEKDADTQYQRWDLKNFDNLPVASGMYVAQVDMPAEGVKKVLKLIVIQETQVLDKF